MSAVAMLVYIVIFKLFMKNDFLHKQDKNQAPLFYTLHS